MSGEVFSITSESVPRVCGSVLGLAGFVTVLLVGLIEGNPAPTILARGLLCMLACAVVGRLLGWAGMVASAEVIERFRAENTPPTTPEALLRLRDKKQRHEAVVEKMKQAA